MYSVKPDTVTAVYQFSMWDNDAADWVTKDVEITVNLHDLTKQLANKAQADRNKKATLAAGAVVARIKA